MKTFMHIESAGLLLLEKELLQFAKITEIVKGEWIVYTLYHPPHRSILILVYKILCIEILTFPKF